MLQPSRKSGVNCDFFQTSGNRKLRLLKNRFFPAPVHVRPGASVDPWVLSEVLTNQQPHEKSETNMLHQPSTSSFRMASSAFHHPSYEPFQS
ncbi:hypothetical protein CapIbe_018010 [Capra ibex]